MRRRKLPPDTRLDWRDPDMPLLCRHQGEVIKLSPEEAQSDASYSMMGYDWNPEGDRLNWRNDPLYHAARKRR